MKRLLLLLLFLFFTTSNFLVAQTYDHLTTLGGLTSGSYLIVGDGNTNDGLMRNSTASSVYIDYDAISNPGTSISSGYTASNIFEITVTGSEITIYNSSVGYVSWGRPGATANDADFYNGPVANTERWTPSVSGGLWTLSNVSTSSRILQWNNSSPRFVAYTSNQVKLKLYKLAVAVSNTVTFDANGGTGTMPPQTESSPTSLNSNAFSRSGFTFAGWTTASDSSGTFYADGATFPFSADEDLYAQWTANGSTISCIAEQDFDANTTWTYTPSPTENSASCVSNGDVWNVLTSLGNVIVPNSAGNFWGGQDLAGASGCGTSGIGTLNFSSVSVSGFTSVEVSFDYEVDGFNASTDDLSYILTLDGIAQAEVYLCNSCDAQNVRGTETISIPNGSTTVELQIRAQFDGGSDYFGLDNFKVCGTSDGPAPELQILDGTAAIQSCGSLTLNYGTLTPSSTADLTFDIENIGTDDLDVSSFSGLSGTDFSIVSPSTPFTVAPSGSQIVTVRYTANSTTGSVNETLTINNNDSDEGTCTVALTGESSSAISIPDNGCSSNNEAVSTFSYSGGSSIDDVNVFVSITHTYRSDLNIEVESPQGTVVQLFDGSNSGSEENLEVNFDDEGSAITSTAHTINGTADEDVTSDVDLLSLFDGENPNGTWTIRICDDANLDAGQLESWSIIITEACVPSYTVSSFTPSEGPEGTEVIVTGTGFTGSTSTTVGGDAATILFQTATGLVIEIPTGASTGDLVITDSACDVNVGSFTVLDESGSCPAAGSFTDIIISEVYDSDANNVIYIELYNPTGVPVDLNALGTDYSIKIDNRNSGDAGITIDRTIDATGTIPAGSTFLLNLGTSGNTCTKTWDFTLSGGGINDYDYIFLEKNGTDVDRVNLASQTGYTFERLGTATGPTTTYNSADWDISLIESCANLGTAPVAPTPPPTVSALSDYNSCELDMSVTATPGNSGTLTYQWYYTDNTPSGWTAVTSSNPAGLTIVGEDSDNLIIATNTNSTVSIDSFQFYVEVIEDGTCSKVSNAARYTVDGELFFRSTGTGNWNDLSTWEMSTSPSGPNWVAACKVPDDINSDYVSIENGHTISVIEGVGAPDLTINELTVQEGGTLIIEEQAELEVTNSGVGADVIINGTLSDEASSGGGNGIDFLGGATWELGANGTIIKTYNSSVARYRDNYENGISNIPATSNWVFAYTGQGQVATVAIDMFYPNLHFESTLGTWDAGSFTEALTGGSGGFATVKGDLNIGVGSITGGTGSCIIYNNNINATPMLVEGDIYIEDGSEFTNDSYDGGSTSGRGNGTGLEVKGDMFIDGVLDVTHGMGELILSGSSKQDIISFGTGSLETYNLEVDNSNNVELDEIDIEIDNTLTFTAGKIITNVSSTDMVWVKNTSAAAISGGNTSGASNYIEGKLQWTTSNGQTYTFPIGHASQNAQGFTIDVTGSGDVLGFLEANATSPLQAIAYCDLETSTSPGQQVGEGTTGQDGILDQVTFNLASPLQWSITNPGSGVTLYNLEVLANGGQDISPVQSANGTDIRYLLKNGEPGNTGAATTNGSPAFSLTGFDYCPNQYTLNGMTSFSSFTLNGSSPASTALPVELLYFNAEVWNKKDVKCTWATATEINNDFFTVERSVDGENFETVGIVQGAGSYNGKLNYEFFDKSPLSGLSYYRLRQTDFDGSFEFSSIVPLQSNKDEHQFKVYPQPFESNLLISSKGDVQVQYVLYDISAKHLISGAFVGELNLNLSQLAAGSYFIRLRSSEGAETIKLLKK